MSTVATVRSWLYRLAASVPTAWHYDRLFRWMVIGAGISLMVFVLRPHDLATSRPIASAPLASVSGGPESTHDASAARTPLAPPVPPTLPNIAPGRSLDGVTITPAPGDSFGTAPSAGHR